MLAPFRGEIYLVTNLINGKGYTGQTTKTVPARWRIHLGKARRTDIDLPLYQAIRKYGEQNFKVEVIEAGFDSHESLNVAEIHWLAALGTLLPHGYNIHSGGSPASPCSTATRAQLRAGKIGHTVSEEARIKIGAASRVRMENPQMKAKLLATHLGIKSSDETKAKLSAARLGRPKPSGMGAKVSKALIGHAVSEEVRDKLRAARLGQKTSDETKAKLSVSVKRLWADPQYRTRVLASRNDAKRYRDTHPVGGTK